MKTNPAISIIVAVYNVEPYIRRCLDSILAQTFTDFEVLLINDGSTDSSGDICDEYASNDSRLRVFHKENGGVSSARNVGIKNARGEYSIHVDPDDYIGQSMLESMRTYAVCHNLDILWTDYYKDKGNYSEVVCQKISKYDAKNYIRGILTGKIHGGMCNKLIKHELYDRYLIQFPVQMVVSEDAFVNIMIAFHNPTIGYLNESYYYYVFRKSSLTTLHDKSTYSYRLNYLKMLFNYKPIKEQFSNELNVSLVNLKIDMMSANLYTKGEIRSFFSEADKYVFLLKQKFAVKLYYYFCLKFGKYLI